MYNYEKAPPYYEGNERLPPAAFQGPPPAACYGPPPTAFQAPPPTACYGPPPTAFQGLPPTDFHGPPPTDFQGPQFASFQGSQPTTTHTTFVIQTPQFGETPVRMMCPNCRNEVVTRVSKEASSTQHIAFVVLLFICFPCSCVPYFIDSLANVRHECPLCNTHLGTYEPK